MSVPGQTDPTCKSEGAAGLEQEVARLRSLLGDAGGIPHDAASTLVHLLMEDAPFGFAFFNTDFRYEVVNRKLAEMNGLPAGNHLRRTVEDIVPNLAGQARRAFQEVVDTGKAVCDREFSGETAAAPGQLRYWSVSYYPVNSAAGSLAGVCCVVTDITERKEAVGSLRINQHRLELAQEIAGIGSWDWDLQTGKIHCSIEYGPLYGLPAGNSAPSYDEWINLVHPEDRARIEAETKRALSAADRSAAEFRVNWPDGSIHWLQYRARIFRDSQGNAIRVLGVNLDITERKNTEQALRDSEKRFREMADNAPMMICASGPTNLATFFNKGWLSFTGRTLEQELGSGWVECVHPDDRRRALADITASSAARRFCTTEYRLRRANGEYRWVLCNGVPTFEPDGDFAGFVGSVIDITDLKRSHDQALSRQKLESLGLLASGIAHDFNNLLGSILADSELLRSDLPAGSAAHEEVERIKLVATRATGIVRELMSYAGQEDPVFEPVDLSALVREMLQLLKVSISKLAVLKVDLPSGLPPVPASAAGIRQVVMNLILNASEALGEKGGDISVAVGQAGPGEFIRLTVSDTGCGIPEEDRARIFDPFFTTKSPGRGLGLAAVQGIVRSHGGQIHLTSAPGQGSRFEVLLPYVARKMVETPKVAGHVSESRTPNQTATVLMVEDEATLRLPVAEILRRRGFRVLEAGDGRSGVDSFRANQPAIDVVLLDMTLPLMSGPEVFDELQKQRPDVKVILTSAYGEEMVVSTLGDRRPWAYIRKPYSPAELVALLGKACLP